MFVFIIALVLSRSLQYYGRKNWPNYHLSSLKLCKHCDRLTCLSLYLLLEYRLKNNYNIVGTGRILKAMHMYIYVWISISLTARFFYFIYMLPSNISYIHHWVYFCLCVFSYLASTLKMHILFLFWNVVKCPQCKII